MKKSVRLNAYFLPFIVLVGLFVPQSPIFAQESCDGSGKLDLTVNFSPALENAQVLGLTSLGVDSKGSGPVLGTFIMANTATDENGTPISLSNLYFEFEISAGQWGLIASVIQQAAYPFSLEPGQVVLATNNDIENEKLPGVNDRMRFDGGLTVEGEEFVESLGGSTTLPSDVYSVVVTVSQVTQACGKVVLASYSDQLGVSETGGVVDEQNIFLKTPGDIIGTAITITNLFPQFSWEGDPSREYRVIVVKDNGVDSPESLINAANSTNPINDFDNGTGSLLEFENIDELVEGISYQFPPSGAIPLEVGFQYFWQVSTRVQGANDFEEIVSDIWSFTISAPGDESASVTQEIDQETFEVLVSLIGEENYSSLVADGFFFEGFTYDNQTYTGIAAVQLLTELVQKIEDGDIIVESN